MRPRILILLVAGVVAACSPPQRRAETPILATSAPEPIGGVPAEDPPARPAFSVSHLRGELRHEVRRANWHAGCPVELADLRVVEVDYWGFDDRVHRGPIVVHRRVASDVAGVFRRLFRARFPIKHVALPARYRPPRPEDRLRTKSVTAGFNCRPVTEGTTLSQHSYGWAVDINPLQNPYVRADGTVLRWPARRYLDRSRDLPGMIRGGDVVVRAFERIGWSWGGRWDSIRDYMHFSLTGR